MESYSKIEKEKALQEEVIEIDNEVVDALATKHVDGENLDTRHDFHIFSKSGYKNQPLITFDKGWTTLDVGYCKKYGEYWGNYDFHYLRKRLFKNKIACQFKKPIECMPLMKNVFKILPIVSSYLTFSQVIISPKLLSQIFEKASHVAFIHFLE
mmetsp:Transcript_20323/g.17985  ORF Transcript_20323/g.17985 Transcript_20323/m.17985 type:complete len:154 (+) Transcript_20323:1-462(+)